MKNQERTSIGSSVWPLATHNYVFLARVDRAKLMFRSITSMSKSPTNAINPTPSIVVWRKASNSVSGQWTLTHKASLAISLVTDAQGSSSSVPWIRPEDLSQSHENGNCPISRWPYR